VAHGASHGIRAQQRLQAPPGATDSFAPLGLDKQISVSRVPMAFERVKKSVLLILALFIFNDLYCG
jgi:hypothetical protein